MKKMIINNEKGFALLAAIIACLILLAVGMLAMNMSVGDLISSSVSVGHKKALSATESGINKLLQSTPDNWPTIAGTVVINGANVDFTDCTPANPAYVWNTIDGGIDSNTKYAVCIPRQSIQAPVTVPGYNISDWGVFRFDGSVAGKSDSYNSFSRVDAGIGFGPVPMNGK
jgi:hypothetical protein